MPIAQKINYWRLSANWRRGMVLLIYKKPTQRPLRMAIDYQIQPIGLFFLSIFLPFIYIYFSAKVSL